MQKVTIRFIGLGLKNNCQAHVIIYNNNSNIIYEGQTYNGIITISLKNNRAYKLVATTNNDIIYTIFYVTFNKYEYKFIFNRSIYSNQSNVITFKLVDYNYSNLPIEKGGLILWQNQ